MGLTEALGPGPTGIDTSLFIYFIEENETFLPLVGALFAEAAAGRREMVTSSLTLLEVLVIPYRAGNHALAEKYEAYLTRSKGLRLVDVGRTQLRTAAQLRALYRSLRTPDAIQLATAISSGCRSFVTGDRDLPRVAGLEIVRVRHRG